MSGDRIRAHFGGLEELQGQQVSHTSQVEELRARLRTEVAKALSNLDGGMGAEEHQRCMQIADKIIAEHVDNLTQYNRSTVNVNQTFQAGGRRAQAVFGSGA